jgi:hypothetical protein
MTISGLIFGLREILVQYVFGAVYTPALGLVALILLQKVLESSVVMPLRHFLDFYGYVRLTLWLMGLILIGKLILSYTLILAYGLPGILTAQILTQVFHGISLILAILFLFRRKISWRMVGGVGG